MIAEFEHLPAMLNLTSESLIQKLYRRLFQEKNMFNVPYLEYPRNALLVDSLNKPFFHPLNESVNIWCDYTRILK